MPYRRQETLTGRGICCHVAKKHPSGVVLSKKVKQLTVCHPECSDRSLQVFPPPDCRGNFTPHRSFRPSCFIYLSGAAPGGEGYTENPITPVQLCGRLVWFMF
jgi:hypothetical protein